MNCSPHQIDPAHLLNPIVEGKATEIFLDRGSFSIVRLKTYRGLHVAAKQFRVRSLRSDVHNEAMFLFGVCTLNELYQIVTQFHGINNGLFQLIRTVTLHREMHAPREIKDSFTWLVLSLHLLEAVDYIHCDAHIIHNDIKEDNNPHFVRFTKCNHHNIDHKFT